MTLLAKGANYYAVEEETRVVLLGSYADYKDYIATGEPGPAEVLAGMADGGKDLVVGTDSLDPGQADALTQAYLDNRTYFEAERDGAIYVLGHYETLLRLREEGDLPAGRARPLDPDSDDGSTAPDGKRVILEHDESDPGLAERLQREYLQRHGQPSS
jgi:hypothetical protein